MSENKTFDHEQAKLEANKIKPTLSKKTVYMQVRDARNYKVDRMAQALGCFQDQVIKNNPEELSRAFKLLVQICFLKRGGWSGGTLAIDTHAGVELIKSLQNSPNLRKMIGIQGDTYQDIEVYIKPILKQTVGGFQSELDYLLSKKSETSKAIETLSEPPLEQTVLGFKNELNSLKNSEKNPEFTPTRSNSSRL